MSVTSRLAAARETVGARQALGLWTVYLTLDTGSQLAFKWAADAAGADRLNLQWLWRAALTPGVWLGVACYVGTLLIWLRVLARMDLSRAFPMSGLSYITVPLLAIALFGESLTAVQTAGIVAICGGVVLLATERAAHASEFPSSTSAEELP